MRPVDHFPPLTVGNKYDRRHAIKRHICVRCGQNADVYRDYRSLDEYTKSGYCQRCQDKFYVEPGE